MSERAGPRAAGAYRIGQEILVHALAFTEDGIGVSVTPVHRFQGNADAGAIGAALRSVLFTPPSIVPPRGWKDRAPLGKQFLEAARVSSWRQLQLKAVSCWIASEGHVVKLTPLRNGGTRGDKKGFQPFGAPEIVLDARESDHALGAALINALRQSE
jgi:hypothetical protein